MLDAHHHFWRYSPTDYPWINDAMAPLRRDFLPEHLKAEIDAAGITGVVSVQARQTLDETRWLLDMAEQHEWIRGVVGWVPLQSPDIAADLSALADRPKLKAVRHVVQDETDPAFMDGAPFNAGIRALKQQRLVYDILIFEHQLPAAIRLVDRHPDQSFVLDHIAKPRIRDGQLSPWRENLRELARRPNVVCKLSGMATEADWQNWTPDKLRPYFEITLDCFGPRRLMFGSDWPVCLVACPYGRWRQIVDDWTATLTADERRQIFSEVAIRAYNL